MWDVPDTHGHETPFEKSTRQGAGATLLHFPNSSLAPHLPPDTESLLTVDQKSLHDPDTLLDKTTNQAALNTQSTSSCEKKKNKTQTPVKLHTMRRRDVPQARSSSPCAVLTASKPPLATRGRCNQSSNYVQLHRNKIISRQIKNMRGRRLRCDC